MSSPSSPLFLLLFLLLSFTSVSSSQVDLTIDSHPTLFRLPPPVALMKDSPGARAGATLACARVRIVGGRSRIRDAALFAHSVKVRLNVTQVDALFRIQTVELCFHRNLSIEPCMCPALQWQKLAKSPWTQSLSPYDVRILDIRMPPDSSRTLVVSTVEEFLLHRVVFLVVGLVSMMMARTLSESVLFYYSSAMTVGIIVVILIILFQGMKLLPTGRKSSLAIFMYSSVVGMTTFFLHYLSGLLRSMLVEIGITEDMHNPLGIFLLVCILLAGAWFGYWGVRKLVLTEEGSVDEGVAYFVEWAILIISAVMILQISLDFLIAIAALIFSIIITVISRMEGKSRVLSRFCRRLYRSAKHTLGYFSLTRDSNTEYSTVDGSRQAEFGRPHGEYLRRASSTSPVLGSTRALSQKLAGDNYISSFHRTPERRKFSKAEWDGLTQEQTKRAMEELISSPDFNRWALANADRISVTSPGNSSSRSQKRHRLFELF